MGALLCPRIKGKGKEKAGGSLQLLQRLLQVEDGGSQVRDDLLLGPFALLGRASEEHQKKKKNTQHTRSGRDKK